MQRLRVSKGALAELLIVTVGVLIALSVDTVREWRENQRLAADARANILNEIRANAARLDDLLPQVERHLQEHTDLHTRLVNVLAGKPMVGEVRLNYTGAGLSSAAYQTAEVTGAFRYMDYDEVRRYSGLYALQAQLTGENVTQSGRSALAPLMLRPAGELSRSELEAVISDIEQGFARLNAQRQTSMRLKRAYAEALKRAESSEPDE